MIPDKVKIGCFTYDVVETDEILIVNGRECVGMIDYNNLEIKIKKTDREQHKEQTFWHEVIHGILTYRSIDISKVELETLVDNIASELYAIMQTNPCLPGQGQQVKR